jgi:UDP-N-acetylglucosamine acyltransferase
MIHPLAAVDPTAVLGTDVHIGPFAVVEAGAVLGDGCRLADHAIVRTGCELGRAVVVDSFAVVGGLPQMKAPKDPPGRVRIGDRTVLREGVTIHRATKPDAVTVVGADCFFMANSHAAHDCVVGDHVTLANNAMLAGHVHMGAGTFVGGGAGVHQFVRIGAGVMIAGNAAISYDVPPFTIAADRNDVCGLNLVGLRRAGVPPAAVADLKACFRAVLFGSGNPRQRAADALLAGTLGAHAQGRQFLEFFAGGKRGFARRRGGRERGDAGGAEHG